MCTDSKDLYDSLSKEGQSSNAEKRLALELVVLRELRQRPEHYLHWFSATQMLADPLTKEMNPIYLKERLFAQRWCYKDTPELARMRKEVTKKAKKVINYLCLQVQSMMQCFQG